MPACKIKKQDRCCCSVAQLCLILQDCSTPDLPVLHHLPELAQTHVHWVSDAIQPSHPLSSPFPPDFNLSQHQGIFHWVSQVTLEISGFKSRDITLPTKVRLVKAMVFPVVMYGCESWTVKKAERRRIDAFELWCWRKLLSPLDCKEIQPVHSEGDQPWDFFGRNDTKAETPVLWPPHVKS